MNKVFAFLVGLASVALAFTSCSAEEDSADRKGVAHFYVNTNAAFTRAVNMAALTNADQYLIDVYDAKGELLFSKMMSEMTDNSVELEEGTYRLVAHYGESKTASQDDLYMVGEMPFVIEAEKESEVEVTCRPASARINVAFTEKMDALFSDYYVTYTTKKLTEEGTVAVWTKTNADPWYLLVEDNEVVKATIHFTRKSDGRSATIEREHTLSAGKAWTLSIDAKEEETPSGTVSLSIVIDDSTNDKEETIVVPNNWWM